MAGAPIACALCDTDDPLGLGLCVSCASSTDPGRSLIFVRPAGRQAGGAGDEILDSLLPGPDRGSSRIALRSGRPLLAVPATVAPPLLRAFEESGLPAREVRAARAWRAMPWHFFVLLACIVIAGALAGITAVPALLWVSPFVAGGFLLAGHLSLRRPVVRPRAGGAWPAALHAEVTTTLLDLPDGAPRDRLIDLLRRSRPLAAHLVAHGDPAGIRGTLHELVAAACDTAWETDRLVRGADTVRSSLIWTEEVAGERRAALARATLLRSTDAANLGLTRLSEAVTALGEIDTAPAGLAGPVGAELVAVTRGLEAAARIHVQTFRELDGLLR